MLPESRAAGLSSEHIVFQVIASNEVLPKAPFGPAGSGTFCARLERFYQARGRIFADHTRRQMRRTGKIPFHFGGMLSGSLTDAKPSCLERKKPTDSTPPTCGSLGVAGEHNALLRYGEKWRAALLPSTVGGSRTRNGETVAHILTNRIRSLIWRLGIDAMRYLRRQGVREEYPPDFKELNREICRAVAPYTMTSPERVNALIDAVQYLVKNKIPGAMVECGVWRGGSAMAIALTLMRVGDENRDIFLYDTFSGMTAPRDVDVSIQGQTAEVIFSATRTSEDGSDWCLSALEEVKENMYSTGYPRERLHFIKGKVEDTIPGHIPHRIALLRLDTDWYESTRHELAHLFPLLEQHGVLIIDDYGYWEGARKAVDEYISDNHIRILLNRIDHTGRIGVKT